MSLSHETYQSPDPSYRNLRVLVSEDVFVATGGVIPPEGTRYSDTQFMTFFGEDYNENFKNYVYVGQGQNAELDKKQAGTLLFAYGKTSQQANTPFQVTTKFGNHYWHPVLKALVFIEDPFSPRSGQGAFGASQATYSGPSYRVRQVYVPPATEGTRFVTEEFYGPVPFDIPQYPTPQPSSISYDVPGARGGFQEALHDKVIIPPTKSATNIVVQGVVNGIIGQIRGQSFPRTNFKRRAPYIIEHNQKQDGGYYAWRIMAFPPPSSKTSEQ